MSVESTKYENLKIALNNWICALKNHLSQINQEVDPITHKHLSDDLKQSETLYYEMTGAKSKEFKELCN